MEGFELVKGLSSINERLRPLYEEMKVLIDRAEEEGVVWSFTELGAEAEAEEHAGEISNNAQVLSENADQMLIHIPY